ncbi:MAG: hypothetical protein ACREJ4_04250 [Candidatus Methylomirabilaceae bacterium]
MHRILGAILVASLALALPAAGQEPTPPRGERIIEALLIWRLVDELDLNEAQIVRIFPRVKALKTIRIEMGRRVPPLTREIRQLIAQAPRDDDAIRIKVTELNLLRAEMEARRRRQLQLIASVLTIEQMGKFTLIQESFETETLRLLQEIRRIVEDQLPPRR